MLLLHGLLHLQGMDHETDGGEMASREAALRAKMRLPVGLIARAAGTAKAKALNAKDAKGKREGRKGKPRGSSAAKSSKVRAA